MIIIKVFFFHAGERKKLPSSFKLNVSEENKMRPFRNFLLLLLCVKNTHHHSAPFCSTSGNDF